MEENVVKDYPKFNWTGPGWNIMYTIAESFVFIIYLWKGTSFLLTEFFAVTGNGLPTDPINGMFGNQFYFN